MVRQVLIDIRESTGYAGWGYLDYSFMKEGWDKLETYTTMESTASRSRTGSWSV
jgi:hypothetical protein